MKSFLLTLFIGLLVLGVLHLIGKDFGTFVLTIMGCFQLGTWSGIIADKLIGEKNENN